MATKIFQLIFNHLVSKKLKNKHFLTVYLVQDLDLYIKTRSPVTFLSEMRKTMQQRCNDKEMRYNITLMNTVVLYIGIQAIQHFRSKGLIPNMLIITHSAHMDIFQNLSVDLDTKKLKSK